MATTQIALVTGGMGGIGEAVCHELHDQGYRVISAYHRPLETAEKWRQDQQKAGYPFDIVYVDVAQYDSCVAMANKIKQEIGHVSILVNNAGITHDVSICKMTPDDWHIVIDTDLNSVFNVTRMFINEMKQKQYGRIINISSINGQKGQFGQVNYCAAKAGIHGFTKALAIEVAKNNITVNTISPGYVATDMVMGVAEEIRAKILAEIPMKRFAQPAEIARVVSFLADERNGYITGANIAINGGHYMI